ncbi:hypothetical protein C8R45DRAFT_1125037 [Mycena sanguinolenta]|nr:hypothetical protein C8R45DRAFT_1125037 [Mycena sanguinolenta]
MTEYDYSPEAIQQYMDSQTRIQQWSADTARSGPCDPSTPPTPAAPRSIALPQTQGSATVRKMRARPNLTIQTSPPRATAPAPANQVYAYTQRTTPYGSQVNITSQTSDGRYIQQQSYHQTTLAAPQSLEVPPVNYAPLARNPYPAPEHLYHSLPRENPRVRSKSSHSERPTQPIYAPPVPPIPERHRAHSSARPAGAAAPLYPASGAYANGMYGAPSAASSSIHLPAAGYLPATVAQYAAMDRAKSKSSATLNMRYATGAHARVEQALPMPVPQHAQVQAQAGFYATPRASKSSATLYAEPHSHSKSSKSKSSSKHERERRPAIPEFGEKMSTPHPAASQMLVHSLVPVASYKDTHPAPTTRTKQPSLFKRMFLGKRST